VVLSADGGADSGFFTVAEVLGGLSPGDEGYPAHGKPARMHASRLWPFNNTKITANEVQLRKMEPGFHIIMDIVDGPDEAGRFLVRWEHTDKPTWEPLEPLWESVKLKQYAAARGLDLRKVLAARAPPRGAAPAAAPRGAAPAGGGGGGKMDEGAASSARGGAAGGAAPKCSVCGLECTLTKKGVVDGRHAPGCDGTGKPPVA